MKYFLRAALLSAAACIAAPASANVFDRASDLLNEGRYEQAYQAYSLLLPLANADAAVQLGFMTIDEQGTDYDPSQALAYFYVANRWNHPEARELISQVEPHLEQEQLRQARELVSRLLERQVITEFRRAHYESADLEPLQPQPLDRAAPQYPSRTFNSYDGGWATARVLVQPDGSVALVDVVQSTSSTFTGQIAEALPSWSYQPISAPATDIVNLTFSVIDESSTAVLLSHVRDNLWSMARFGSIEHQRELGLYLLALHHQRGYRVSYDRDNEYANAPTLDRLLNGENGDEWPLTWSPGFWLNSAAQQGDVSAQRALALTHSQWAEYLILRGDERTQAWRGLTLLTRAKQEREQELGRNMLRALVDSDDDMVQAILAQVQDQLD
ncbi:MAG: hypothetical protein JJU03_13535 [Idiomarina sp.]|nr:hypothetical protein [Idiomarina sp.]